MWILYSFITAFSETSKDIIGKTLTKKTDEYLSAFALQFFSALFLLPLVLYQGIPELKPVYFLTIASAFFLMPLRSFGCFAHCFGDLCSQTWGEEIK